MKKRIAKAGFTRIENLIKAVQPDTTNIEEVNLRLNKLEEIRKSLEEILIKLAVHDKKANDAEIDQEIASYEERYSNLKF